jgi:anti-sigma regulatory factor (Ser/Thr protein kinase)
VVDFQLEASLGIEPDPEAPRRARRFIREFCAAAELDPDVCETAALLTSELVTNAILHGRTRARLTARRPGDRLHVSVQDQNPALPAVGSHDLTAESGRGLAIVAALADDWGIETDNGSKAVWFALDV